MPDKADRVPLDGAFVLQFIMFASDGSLWMRTYTLPGPTDRGIRRLPCSLPLHPLSLGSKLFDGLLDALHGLGVYPPGGSDDTLVGAQGPSQRKVQGSTVHIGDDPTGFGDEQGTRGVVL